MREENPIEVAISQLWNASIHFIFLSSMKGEIPLLRSVSTHIICWMLLVLIWARAAKSQMVKCREDSIICNGLIYLDDKTRSFILLNYVCLYVCIYSQSIKNR